MLSIDFREWRKSSGHESSMLGTGPAVHDPMPSPSVSASRKKQKIASSLPSHSFAGPSPTFHQPAAIAANQTSSSAAKRGRMMGPKGKKHKSVSQNKKICKLTIYFLYHSLVLSILLLFHHRAR